MIVLILSKCPSGLKGDVTKWLLEVDTGIYVGNLSSRVRELLWKRVCNHCGAGTATMIFSVKNEQGFSVYGHNTIWKPTDFDGIVLLKKPLPSKINKQNPLKTHESRINRNNAIQSTNTKKDSSQIKPDDITISIARKKRTAPTDFVAIDMETTGLKSNEDSIIELAAVRYKQEKLVDQYHVLVSCKTEIPIKIVQLTGIKNELLNKHGQSIENAIKGLLDFIQDDILVGHYISFDMLFLRKACSSLNLDFKGYQVIDTVTLAKEVGKETVDNYKLTTLVSRYNISNHQEHRALPDAILAAKLYLKLKEKV